MGREQKSDPCCFTADCCMEIMEVIGTEEYKGSGL